MGTIPAVPVFPAGATVTSANLNLLGTAITWCLSGKPECQLPAGTIQSVSNSTLTAVTWDTNQVNRDSGWSSGSNTRYTAQTPGIYLAGAAVPYASNATGARLTCFRVTTGSNNPAGSGATTLFASRSASAATPAAGSATRSLTPYMYVNDYIEVLTSQNSGGALSTSVTSALGKPWFTIVLASG